MRFSRFIQHLSLFLLLGTVAASWANAGPPTTRDEAVSAYAQVQADSSVDAGWTGSTASCSTGSESQASLDSTLRTLNTLRSFVDARPVTWDPALNEKALSAATMMLANGTLDHYPTSDWLCYSDVGASGAGTSNLYLGASGASAMVGYVLDDNVDSLGHRFWALDATAVTMGTGSTGGSNALTVIGNESREVLDPPPMTSWPPAGWIPDPWIPLRWSATVPTSTDMSGVTVVMTMDGKPLQTGAVTAHGAGYGSGSSVSWVPAMPEIDYSEGVPQTTDHEYTVTLSGAPIGTKTYTVHSVDVSGIEDISGTGGFSATHTPEFLSKPKLRVKGKKRPGAKVTASVKAENAERKTYRWMRNGRTLKGETRAFYVLTRKDRGSRIRVEVTLHGSGGTAKMRSANLSIPRS